MYNKTKAAREALLAYMEWWSETTFCAGWLPQLPDYMVNRQDNGFRFLVESAGGWWIYGESGCGRSNKENRKFIKGTWKELYVKGSGE